MLDHVHCGAAAPKDRSRRVLDCKARMPRPVPLRVDVRDPPLPEFVPCSRKSGVVWKPWLRGQAAERHCIEDCELHFGLLYSYERCAGLGTASQLSCQAREMIN